MNYFQLIIKQMRQRALSTWLTIFSVILGVSLAIAIMVLGRESQELFGQNEFGYDVIVGIKASQLQLTLNTIYHMDVSPGNISYSNYGRFLKIGPSEGDMYKYTAIAVPTVVGDTLKGKYRIVGTLAKFFGVDEDGNPLPPEQVMNYRPGKHLEFDQGHVFARNKFEGVIGSDVAELEGLKLGDTFQATHDQSGSQSTVHAQKWTVVGILKSTHTAIDRVVYIPLMSFYTIGVHGIALAARNQLQQGQALTASGSGDDDQPHPPDENGIQHFQNYDFDTHAQTFKITLDPEILALSAILVQSKGGYIAQKMMYDLNTGSTEVMAVNPATVMRAFFDTFLKPTRLMLLLICSMVTVVAAVGILVSIYNSVSSRLREIAILRALGATRQTVLSLICLEAGLIALIGSIVGLIVGHGVTAVGSWYMNQTFGESINWYSVDWYELAYIAGVVVLALVAGLVPAIKAYRTSVAANLVAV